MLPTHIPSEAARRMDDINRRAWRDPSTIRRFRILEGCTDAGEQAALDFVRARASGQPILDLGVGAGRTVPLLCAISHDYIGLDYTPELLEVGRKKHPGVRLEWGDARDLSRFSDESFGLVVFSFNGIDTVNPADRVAILREARRVLRPGGTLVFSTHNRSGPGHGEPLRFGFLRTRSPIKMAARLVVAALHARRATRNYRAFSKLGDDTDSYSIRNASAHDHGILVHYITLQEQLRQLERLGFSGAPVAFANSDGRRLSPGDDTADVWWFHLVVRK